MDLLHVAADMTYLADVYDPSKGGGTAPPGAEKFQLILRWIFYLFTLFLAGVVLVVAGKIGAAFRHGEGSEAVKSLGYVLAACVLGGSASGIISLLLT